MRRLLVLLGVIALSMALAPTAAATPPAPANGTITLGAPIITSFRSAGGNTFITLTRSITFTGTVSGTASAEQTVVVHASGEINFNVLLACPCTVAAASGSVVVRVEGRGSLVTGTFTGHMRFISGTGDLANLHFNAAFTQDPSGIDYSGTYHFDP